VIRCHRPVITALGKSRGQAKYQRRGRKTIGLSNGVVEASGSFYSLRGSPCLVRLWLPEKSVAHLVESAPRRQTCRNVPRAEELHCSDRTALWRKTEKMPTSEMDRLAAEAMYRREDFQEGLSSEKRKYPIQKFRAFWSATKRYAELTKSDSLSHKSVAAAVQGLVDFLGAEREPVPGEVLRGA
jgi:hypothetical protein